MFQDVVRCGRVGVAYWMVLILTLATVWGMPLPGTAAGTAGGPELQAPAGKPCVREPEWMRRNHMEFLKHKRELTVREGVRIRDESLLACATCHTSHEQFCDRCHQYVGVDPNCFQCHNYPR